MMNGEHTEFNRLLGLGNNLLMARQGLVNAPLRLPQVDLTTQQTAALEKAVVIWRFQNSKVRTKSAHDWVMLRMTWG
jgi:hypothetical protein